MVFLCFCLFLFSCVFFWFPLSLPYVFLFRVLRLFLRRSCLGFPIFLWSLFFALLLLGLLSRAPCTRGHWCSWGAGVLVGAEQTRAAAVWTSDSLVSESWSMRQHLGWHARALAHEPAILYPIGCTAVPLEDLGQRLRRAIVALAGRHAN